MGNATSQSEADKDVYLPTEDEQDVARKYDDPTFIMMKNGENVGKVIGANKDELKGTIEKLKA